MTRRQAVALMVLVTLMWSIAGVVLRQLEHVRAFEVTFWRSFFTLLSLLVLLPVFRGRGVFAHLRKEGGAVWLSGVCWGVVFTAFMLALTLTSVANVLVTGAVGPLLTALLAQAVMGQRVAARTWLAIMVAGSGMAYMYVGQMRWGGDGTALGGMAVALWVPLAAACNWTLVQRSHAQGHAVDLTVSVWLGAGISCLFMLPLAWPLAASAHDVAWLALLGVVQLAIPCVLCVLCIKVLKAPEVSLLALLEVIFGIALAWVGAGEVPDGHVLIGAGLVLLALAANEALSLRSSN